jgi:hypothetical protein
MTFMTDGDGGMVGGDQGGQTADPMAPGAAGMPGGDENQPQAPQQ